MDIETIITPLKRVDLAFFGPSRPGHDHRHGCDGPYDPGAGHKKVSRLDCDGGYDCNG